MPLDPTLDELSGSQQWSPSDAASMTHWPQQPNPAQPWLERARQFASGGITEALGQGGGWPSYIAHGLGEAASIAGGPALGIMAGPRAFTEMGQAGKSALGDLALARQMQGRGFDRSQIRAATQWYPERPTGTWNKEVFDYPSSINENEIRGNTKTTVGTVLNHNDLYSIYPHLKDMPLIFATDVLSMLKGQRAAYAHPSQDYPNGVIIVFNPQYYPSREIQSSILHELTHAVDKYEGNPLSKTDPPDLDTYFKSAHEVRARNTQYRAKYPPEYLTEERMDPWNTQLRMEYPVEEHEIVTPP